MMRRTVPCLLLALSGCSFIDDFDRFRPAAEARDGSVGDASLDAQPDEDGGSDDAGDSRDDASDQDAEPSAGDELCRGKDDGTSCGDEGALLCLKGFCRTSRCGDGYVDDTRGEQCDELNLIRRDGCEPGNCVFSCTSSADCDNGVVCDGEEQCDIQRHRCVPDPLSAVGKLCTVRGPSGVQGLCDEGGYCIGPNCGDGKLDTGEECDPSDPDAGSGCRRDCSQGCSANQACDDMDACNGVETCELARGECKSGMPPSCVDGNPCSLDGQCAPGTGCVFPLADADSDGVSEESCAPGSSLLGGDCARDDNTVYPGATKYCDGRDNDCDGATDEEAVMATCYPDADRDGYPTQQGGFMACQCPAGTRVARGDGLWDCWDAVAGGADARPGQTSYFGTGYPVPCPGGNGTCVSYDYDCSGSTTALYLAGSGSCGLLGTSLLCTANGYDGAAPPCGEIKNYIVCESGVLACTARTMQLRQLCR